MQRKLQKIRARADQAFNQLVLLSTSHLLLLLIPRIAVMIRWRLLDSLQCVNLFHRPCRRCVGSFCNSSVPRILLFPLVCLRLRMGTGVYIVAQAFLLLRPLGRNFCGPILLPPWLFQ